MRRTFMSMETKAFFMEDVTVNANAQFGDLGAC